jgi:rubrerythrin
MPIRAEELEEKIQKSLANEIFNFEVLNKTNLKTSNPVIKLILNQLALDSKKHENILNIILTLIHSSENAMDEENENFDWTIHQHIKYEDEMLNNYEKLVDETKDKRIRFLLQNIISDEEKHHFLAKRMYELVCKGNQITDEKWWDFLFRYSRLSK